MCVDKKRNIHIFMLSLCLLHDILGGLGGFFKGILDAVICSSVLGPGRVMVFRTSMLACRRAALHGG